MKSEPPQKIHRTTNTFPNNPNSPFYGPDPIKPMALLKLRRIHPKPGEPLVCTPGSEEEEEDDEGVEGGEAGFGGVEGDMDGDGVLSPMEKQKLMMMKQGDISVCKVELPQRLKNLRMNLRMKRELYAFIVHWSPTLKMVLGIYMSYV